MTERVQKIMARTLGISRRQAEELIRQGLVKINGRVAQLGDTADGTADTIKVQEKPLPRPEKLVYYLLNKPRGYLCTVADPEGRPTVMELVRTRVKVYPVGRLDFNSTGLVLLTNDGNLAYRLTKAGKHCPKIYLAKVAGIPSEAQLDRLRGGIRVEDEKYAPCEITARRQKEGAYSWLQITLFQGKNRQIRKMFDAIHHPVFQLKRVAYGPLTDAGLPIGQCRPLTEEEIRRLNAIKPAPPSRPS